ncbi:efflux RND transporter periplasmic adaptor subunit [Aliiruegeria sabulilitoris]|uniref:efflux RND transporter periplasmic adaptor subunit n=1 Tax=Aliiruegeria sabulilitoris TaxID=1510458 RepID=UPI000834E1F2|nr:efflux RND transporter periplasmic adaptor subunit [Aliiruegeria sabulilitoris]NDR54951.1 efflux RND transporter periplasmic adaptor subunit [Pseudoruegeria sp. M32A2M]
MKWFSFLIAAIVAGVVYMLIMERDAVFEFAGIETGRPAAPAAAPDATSDVAETIENTDDGPKRVSIVAMASTAQVIDSAVILRGRTEATRQVVVAAETSGPIVSEPLRKGTMVEAGDLLCEIDPGPRIAQLSEAKALLASAKAGPPVARARVIEAEALLAEAEINNRAATKLIEGGFASETRVASTQAAVSAAKANVESAHSGLEAATSNVEAAAAAVALAEKEMERVTLKAPFAGLLETDTAELGALMQPGASCATIIQLHPMKLVGFVPETQVDKVTVGAPAGARLVSGAEVSGAVTFLSRSADPQTRTFRVEIEVPNTDLRIRDGQTADIAISATGETAHLLPASALTLDDAGVLGLRIVEQSDTGPVAAFVPVRFLRDTPEGVYVAGLPTDIDVIVVGQEYVTDGVPLKVSYQEEGLGQ